MSRPTVRHMLYHGWRPEAVTQRHLALYGDRVDRSLLPAGGDSRRAGHALHARPRTDSSDWSWPLDDAARPHPCSCPAAARSRSRRVRATPGSTPGGHDGYVVVPVLADSGFRIEVFDAADVARGPLAIAASPGHVVAFLIHSAWMPRAVRAQDLPRTSFASELDRLAVLPAELAAVARRGRG